jgi:hypothetical protein
MITFLTAVGLAVIATGVFVIASSGVVRICTARGRAGDGALFADQEHQAIAVRSGVLMTAMGAVLAALDFAGIVLSPAAAAIAFFIVIGFLFAHNNYLKHRRSHVNRHGLAPDDGHELAAGTGRVVGSS